MTKLEKLLAELCPDGVEYRKLGELCFIKARIGWQRLTKNEYLEIGDFYLVTGVDIRPNHRVDFSSCYYVSKERYEMDTNIQLQNGDIIVTKDGTIGKVALIENMDKPAVLNSHLFVIRDITGKLNNKFLMHVLLSNYFKLFITKRSTSGTIQGLNQSVMVEFPIPLPPLEVQAEIVHILDSFTELTEELTTELTARKKQYEYYRDELLCCSSGKCEWRTIRLGDICSIITKGTTPKSYENTGIAFIKTEAFVGRYIDKSKLSFVSEETHNGFLKRSILQENDILFTIAGATIGKMAIVTADILPANTNQACAIIRLKKCSDLGYIKYILESGYMKKYMSLCIKGSAQPNLNLQQLNDFKFPYPTEETIIKITSILDRFDKLCNDISEGLPAEIEARRKQYEYYRDKLLTFTPKG